MSASLPGPSRLSIIGSLALVACAPVASFRAPLPLAPTATDQLSVGGGFDAEGGVVAPASCGTAVAGGASPCLQGLSGQLWGAYRQGHLELSGVLFLGSSTGLGGGGGLRYYFIDQPGLQLGLDGQLGWLWADLGMPVGVRLMDSLWLYSRPSAVVSYQPHVQLPVGVALRLTDALAITPEVGAVAGGTSGPAQLSVYVGLGASWKMDIDRRPPEVPVAQPPPSPVVSPRGLLPPPPPPP